MNWSEDMSGCSLEEILDSQTVNRAWGKEVRTRISALVDSRLAKQISRDEYAANRKQTDEQAAECRRRAMLLLDVLAGRAASAARR